MIISDLDHLKTVVESSELQGGLFNFGGKQLNVTYIKQVAYASAGNGSGISIGNTALALNIANVLQGNL